MQIDKKYRLERAVSTDEGDESGWMSPDALKLARKANPRGLDSIRIVLNGSHELQDGSTLKKAVDAICENARAG